MELLWQDEDACERLLVCRGTNDPLFQDVQLVRAGGVAFDRREVFSFDSYSDHYCFTSEEEPVGCVSVTQALEGPLDCEQFYPPRLLERYRRVLASSCKLRVLSPRGRSTCSRLILNQMLRVVWRDQVQLGMRIDIVNATARLTRFYVRRLGYLQLSSSPFIHPHLGTKSFCLCLPADPARPSFVREECRGLLRPVAIDNVLKELRPTVNWDPTTCLGEVAHDTDK